MWAGETALACWSRGMILTPARGPGFRFWKSFVIVNSPLELKERLKVDFDVKL